VVGGRRERERINAHTHTTDRPHTTTHKLSLMKLNYDNGVSYEIYGYIYIHTHEYGIFVHTMIS
jgi:hypothetical protein